MEYIPKVLQAVAGEDFTIYLYFSDGSVRLYDVSGDMDPCNCIDLDPIELYETCPVVVDPLEKAS